jgi:hypothetical protein
VKDRADGENKNNTSTIGVYETIGFKKASSLVQDIGEKGFLMDDYAMEKTV